MKQFVLWMVSNWMEVESL